MVWNSWKQGSNEDIMMWKLKRIRLRNAGYDTHIQWNERKNIFHNEENPNGTTVWEQAREKKHTECCRCKPLLFCICLLE